MKIFKSNARFLLRPLPVSLCLLQPFQSPLPCETLPTSSPLLRTPAPATAQWSASLIYSPHCGATTSGLLRPHLLFLPAAGPLVTLSSSLETTRRRIRGEQGTLLIPPVGFELGSYVLNSTHFVSIFRIACSCFCYCYIFMQFYVNALILILLHLHSCWDVYCRNQLYVVEQYLRLLVLYHPAILCKVLCIPKFIFEILLYSPSVRSDHQSAKEQRWVCNELGLVTIHFRQQDCFLDF